MENKSFATNITKKKKMNSLKQKQRNYTRPDTRKKEVKVIIELN
tara:strand:+ start:68 stop:199 length:132 start_codon:yes stop_codon:yes gene_type:complete